MESPLKNSPMGVLFWAWACLLKLPWRTPLGFGGEDPHPLGCAPHMTHTAASSPLHGSLSPTGPGAPDNVPVTPASLVLGSHQQVIDTRVCSQWVSDEQQWGRFTKEAWVPPDGAQPAPRSPPTPSTPTPAFRPSAKQEFLLPAAMLGAQGNKQFLKVMVRALLWSRKPTRLKSSLASFHTRKPSAERPKPSPQDRLKLSLCYSSLGHPQA